MTEKRISSAEAKAHFRAVLDDVLHHGGRYVVERHGRAVAAIVGVEEGELLAGQHRPEPSAQRIGAMALVSLWDGIPVDAVGMFFAEFAESRIDRAQELQL